MPVVNFWRVLMNSNDVLRRIRYVFDYNDKKMSEVFALADFKVTHEKVNHWLRKEDDEDFEELTDEELTVFLNGLINEKRGKKEGAQPAIEKQLNNNMILMKLKIALNLKAEDVLALLNLAGFNLSKHELSAFFRKADHKHYRRCKDQILRNFLNGIQLKYRPKSSFSAIEPKKIEPKTTNPYKSKSSPYKK